MSLDIHKLEKLRELGNGALQARCPACAEAGQDRTGEHLRIYPDGKFGCCVHPKDGEHRRRIFALAGERKRRGIQVKVSATNSSGEVKRLIFGKLKFANVATTDGPDGVNEVETEIIQTTEGRTPRTGESKSSEESFKTADQSRTLRTGKIESSSDLFQSADYLRTLRTPQYSYTLANKHSVPDEKENNTCATHKEFSTGVRSVRQQETAVEPLNHADKSERLPYFTPGGTLVIPFASPEKFHWWKGGQSIAETRQQLLALERKENDASPF